MAGQQHIICVDDEDGILVALRHQLQPFSDDYQIDLAHSGHAALDLVAEIERDGDQVAMVIADQIMPGMKGVELLEEVHRRFPDTIKILLTGQAGLDTVIRAINNAGLDRYLGKPWDEPDLRMTVDVLLSKYQLSRENQRLIADLRRSNDELRHLNADLEKRVRHRTDELARANQRLSQLAITDGLTGVYNHRYFHERLALEVERSGRTELPLALLMVDVDYFKTYNDLNGHPAGDKVLARVAELLAVGRRVNDVVARYGGEEFAVLLIDTPAQAAAAVAHSILQRVASESFENEAAQPDGLLSVSVGVANCPDDADDAGALLLAADSALYKAKRNGRNRVAVAGDSGVLRSLK
ncbi:MAG: diguanylate cyclase [Deltaproteobacteria bacterium]|nr:diguanylate cyclase [Deltaproteobacteria bacterium]